MTIVQNSEKRINVVQGTYHVTNDANTVLTTLLGSCVAACIRDPIARVGGMNHFLLPEEHDLSKYSVNEAASVHLMELLVNELMKMGAKRDRLEAKIFGGAKVLRGVFDIGARNADFAVEFLRLEGIPCTGGHTKGNVGRSIQYWPVSGRARQRFLTSYSVENEVKKTRSIQPPATPKGDVELF